MKYSLLSVTPRPHVNIGDYIQALAARQYLPEVDSFVSRERLKDYDGDATNMIMNAWYMYDSTQWPPSQKINPLFVSIHINPIAEQWMLSEESINYLKQYEPIGCRDKYTERNLQARGVDAYFSGCLTLTLGKDYHTSQKDGRIYIVDLPVTFGSILDKLYYLAVSSLHLRRISAIFSKIKMQNGTFMEKWRYASKFYCVYRRIMDEDVMFNAEYINHRNVSDSDDERILAAESLVKKYAKASLVITSRLHCALPCLGLETPVLFVYNDKQSRRSACRMDGLLDLLNVIHWTGKELKSDIYNSKNKISRHNIIPNKDSWKQYADSLSEKCRKFVKMTSSR